MKTYSIQEVNGKLNLVEYAVSATGQKVPQEMWWEND